MVFASPPLKTFGADWRAACWGVAAAIPPLAVFWACIRCPLQPFRRILQILDETILPLFRPCRLMELAVLAAMAGLGEEMLFRGVVQAATADAVGLPRGPWLGLAVSAVAFGLLHAVTPVYCLLAGLIGLYLGGIWLATGNLLTPILAHGVYDFLALWFLLADTTAAPVPEHRDCRRCGVVDMPPRSCNNKPREEPPRTFQLPNTTRCRAIAEPAR